MMKLTRMTVNEIADRIVDYLMLLPDGTEVSTGEVVDKLFGVDRLEDAVHIDGKKPEVGEMIAIDNKVNEIAKMKGLILDGTKYSDMDVGLSYNIPFVVTRYK